MLDFWKAIVTTAITSVFSWPVAIVVLGLLLRPDISALIKRLRSLILKHGETSIEAQTGGAVEQSEKAKPAEPALLSSSGREEGDEFAKAGPVQLSLNTSPDPESEIARRQMIDFGKGIPIVQEQEEKIRLELNRRHFDPHDPVTTEVLIRNLAYNQVLAAAERLYRLIFGSQISLLKSLNVGPPHSDSDIRRFYEEARAQYPKFYGTYSYEAWRDFLISQSVVSLGQETGRYAITELGKEFLKWLITASVSENKAG